MACTSNLMKKVFPDSEIAKKLTSVQIKTEIIISGVISPRAIATVKASMADIPFCGVPTDDRCKQSSNVKNFASPDSIF
jgi:hypothetical protein